MGGTGHSSVRKSVIASAEYKALPHRTEYGDFANRAVYPPYTVWYTAFDQIMEEEVQAAVLGKKSPEQALNDAQDRLTDIAAFQYNGSTILTLVIDSGVWGASLNGSGNLWGFCRTPQIQARLGCRKI